MPRFALSSRDMIALLELTEKADKSLGNDHIL